MTGNTASGALHCVACHGSQVAINEQGLGTCVACGYQWHVVTAAEFIARHGRTPAEQRELGARLGRAWFTDECAPSLDAIKEVERQTILLGLAASPVPLVILGAFAFLILGVRCS